jgi:iron complex transport system substrate-binding protein
VAPLRARALVGVAFVVATLACARAKGRVALRDDRGVTIEIAGPPHRIVSLLPSLTETVCALGACECVVGTDRFSNWPARIATLPKLGGIEDPQIERVVALKPDIVLASTSARVTERLEALGLKVIALESEHREDVRRTLTLLGQLLGAEKKADEVWFNLERDVRTAAARVPAAMRGRRVYFEVDPTPYAAGPTSFIGRELSELGLGNAIAAELGPFPRLNPELVVRAQPDIIMSVNAAVAEMSKRPGWDTLRALRDGRVCAFPSATYELIVRPGPRMGEAAAAIADCLVGLK